VADPVRTLTVLPTTEALPVMRKSPNFHFAVPMVTWSVTWVGVNDADFGDSAP
jgi:hypothetical protein